MGDRHDHDRRVRLDAPGVEMDIAHRSEYETAIQLPLGQECDYLFRRVGEELDLDVGIGALELSKNPGHRPRQREIDIASHELAAVPVAAAAGAMDRLIEFL
jgi:hypothetical protein